MAKHRTRPFSLVLGLIAGLTLATVWVTDARSHALKETVKAPAAPKNVRAVDALRAASAGNWARAKKLAATAKDPVVAKLIAWMRLKRPGASEGFEAYADFVTANPDWPALIELRRQAEAAIRSRVPAKRLVAWFAAYPPVSSVGRFKALVARVEAGAEPASLRAAIAEAWVATDFDRATERAFLRRFRKLLTAEDHIARVDRLLWDGKHLPALRSAGLLRDKGYRQLAEARIALRQFAGGVDGAIARVPAKLRNDAGLWYERLRWRRIKNRDDSAREILAQPPTDMVRPDLWWQERAVLVRRSLDDGLVADAYAIARDHGLEPGGEAYAEAEWLAGWIALRFRDDAAAGYRHFTQLRDAVRYPISLGRANYWAGRAAEKMGEATLSRQWYAEAARYRSTFYGQLAAARIGVSPRLPTAEARDPVVAARWEGHELIRAARLLGSLGKGGRKELKLIFERLVELAGEPDDFAAIGAVAADIGRRDLGIQLAKSATRRAVLLPNLGYPMVALPEAKKSVAEPALVHALIRQESAFDLGVVSYAGARGMMQLMPATAKMTARMHRIKYDRAALTADATYNIRIGRAHLDDLLRAFDGSYVLALAAYNAGASRPRRWMRANGDPRRDEIDVIDWIELIPVEQTRDYVQRVMENIWVYRQRFASRSGLTLAEDLARGPAADVAQGTCAGCAQ